MSVEKQPTKLEVNSIAAPEASENEPLACSRQERRCILGQPCLEGILRIELPYVDAVNGGPRATDLADFLLSHLADPQDPPPLESARGQVDGSFIERLVEVAAADQYKVHEVAGECEQPPFGRIVSPEAEPAVREPGTVAIDAKALPSMC